jgi:hypothetical protein
VFIWSCEDRQCRARRWIDDNPKCPNGKTINLFVDPSARITPTHSVRGRRMVAQPPGGDGVEDLEALVPQRVYSEIRDCSERTIERERASGTGCPYIKIGRSVRYRRRDIIDFIERHVRRSTSEPSQ